ncbi:ALP1-like protein isoform X1 [Tanacetum coccineum]
MLGQFARGDKKYPTIMLEAVASYDLWIWHAFFGVSGANNDLTVLNNSLLFDDLLDDIALVAPFECLMVNLPLVMPSLYVFHNLIITGYIFKKVCIRVEARDRENEAAGAHMQTGQLEQTGWLCQEHQQGWEKYQASMAHIYWENFESHPHNEELWNKVTQPYKGNTFWAYKAFDPIFLLTGTMELVISIPHN